MEEGGLFLQKKSQHVTMHLPQWSTFDPHARLAEAEKIIARGMELAESISAHPPEAFGDLVVPFERIDAALLSCWAPVGHMNNVMHDIYPNLESVYGKGVVLLSRYASDLGQHEELYKAFAAYRHRGEEYKTLSNAKKKIVDDKLRDFKLAGAELSLPAKRKLKDINEQLTALSDKFENNIQKAQTSWRKIITDNKELSGVPAITIDYLHQAAAHEGVGGHLVTIHGPIYRSIMSYAHNQALRREVYEAHITRASDQGPDQGKWDNAPLIREILSLRHHKAELLGFANYNEYSLARKMAESVGAVTEFLNELNEKVHPIAEREFEVLKKFAKEKLCMDDILPWDDLYVREAYRKSFYQIDQEVLRLYFPLDKVLSGLFELLNKIYGVTLRERTQTPVWASGVRFFDVHDKEGELRGGIYFDLFARNGKRPGAWHDSSAERFLDKDILHLPVGYVNCNFTPPDNEGKSFLLHDEIVTLYHECGHALHHALTRADFPSLSMNQVEWDAIEFPSQIMENWCWESDMLRKMSLHKETGAVIPDKLIQSLRKSKLLFSGLFLARQLTLGIFDWLVHLSYEPKQPSDPQYLWEDVRKSVGVIPMPEWNRFINGFGHIFGGGYAAGYYSYLWAETLSSDVFNEFLEKGIFDRPVGSRFLSDVIEQGAMRPMMENFRLFRGREPEKTALLKHYGLW